jgi:uncharacterized protein YceH (UPF0502 family)
LLAGDVEAMEEADAREASSPGRGSSDRERIAVLEQEVAELKRAFEDFRRNFE